MKRKIAIFGSVISILLIAFGIYFIQREMRSRHYSEVHPQTGRITEAIYALGKIKSNKKYEVKIGVISNIVKIFVKEGDYVKKNAPLIEFESRVAFRAPFSGTVTFIQNNEGEIALPQIPLLRLEDLDDKYIELSLEQEAALRVKPGQTARVSFESLRGDNLTGVVSTIFPRNEELIANITVPGLKRNILPGMTADVSVEVGQTEGLTVPVRAVRNGFVTVRRHGKTQNVKVEIGLVDNFTAEIKGQTLNENDTVLVPKE